MKLPAAATRRLRSRSPMRPRLESLESRVVMDVSAAKLTTTLGLVSDHLDTAFSVASLLPAEVPLVPELLKTVKPVADQLKPVIDTIRSMNPDPAITVQQFLTQIDGGLSEVDFRGITPSSGGNSVSFLMDLKPGDKAYTVQTGNHLKFNIELANGDSKEIDLPFPALSVDVTSAVTATVRVVVDNSGVSLVPGDTHIIFKPTISASTAEAISGTVGGLVDYEGTVALDFSPDFDIKANGDVTLTGGQEFNLPLALTLKLAPLPDLGIAHTVKYNLATKQFVDTFTTIHLGEVGDPSTAVYTTDPNAPAAEDQLIKKVARAAAGPLFERLDAWIPDDVRNFLLGEVELYAGGPTLNQALGNETLITRVAQVADYVVEGGNPGFTTLGDFLVMILRAEEFAADLNNETVDRARLNELESTNEGKGIGLSFPFLKDPLGSLVKAMQGQNFDLLTFEYNLVDKFVTYLVKNYGGGIVPRAEVIRIAVERGVLEVDEHGTPVRIHAKMDQNKLIEEEVVKYLRKAAEEAGVAEAFDKLVELNKEVRGPLDGFLNPLEGEIIVSGGIVAGIDSGFLMGNNPILESLFIKSGDLINVNFDIGMHKHFSTQIDNPFNKIKVKTGQREVDKVIGVIVKTVTEDVFEETFEFFGKVAEAQIDLDLDGHAILRVPQGAQADGKLTFAEIFGDPHCVLVVDAVAALNLDVQATVVGQDLVNGGTSFVLVTPKSPCDPSEGPAGAASEVPPPFAEIDPDDPTRLLVYGSSSDDSIVIRQESPGVIQASRGGQLLSFAGITQVVVDLRGTTPRTAGVSSEAGGDDDVLIASNLPETFAVTVQGGDGDDEFTAKDGVNRLFPGRLEFYGNGGTDELTGGAGESLLDGGDLDDILQAGTGPATLLGGLGDDELSGPDRSFMSGTSPNGGLMVGGPGQDTLGVGTVARGSWTLIGGNLGDGDAGPNDIYGGYGDDLLIAGNATLQGGDYVPDPQTGGSSFLAGGPGDDRIYGGPAGDTLLGGWVASNTVPGDDEIHGGGGRDEVFSSHSGLQDDGELTPLAARSTGASIVFGEADDDLIYFGHLNDTVFGSDGNDVIRGTVDPGPVAEHTPRAPRVVTRPAPAAGQSISASSIVASAAVEQAAAASTTTQQAATASTTQQVAAAAPAAPAPAVSVADVEAPRVERPLDVQAGRSVENPSVPASSQASQDSGGINLASLQRLLAPITVSTPAIPKPRVRVQSTKAAAARPTKTGSASPGGVKVPAKPVHQVPKPKPATPSRRTPAKPLRASSPAVSRLGRAPVQIGRKVPAGPSQQRRPR